MADIYDLQSAISDTEDFARAAQNEGGLSQGEIAIMYSNLAIARAIQEVGVRLDYVIRDLARNITRRGDF